MQAACTLLFHSNVEEAVCLPNDSKLLLQQHLSARVIPAGFGGEQSARLRSSPCLRRSFHGSTCVGADVSGLCRELRGMAGC